MVVLCCSSTGQLSLTYSGQCCGKLVEQRPALNTASSAVLLQTHISILLPCIPAAFAFLDSKNVAPVSPKILFTSCYRAVCRIAWSVGDEVSSVLRSPHIRHGCMP